MIYRHYDYSRNTLNVLCLIKISINKDKRMDIGLYRSSGEYGANKLLVIETILLLDFKFLE